MYSGPGITDTEHLRGYFQDKVKAVDTRLCLVFFFVMMVASDWWKC